MFYNIVGELVLRTAFATGITYLFMRYVFDNPNPDVPVIIAVSAIMSLIFMAKDA
jgi:hypothetical protein